MDPSMLLTLVSIMIAAHAARLQLGRREPFLPPLTIAVAAMEIVCLGAQMMVPDLLQAVRRDPGPIAAGQYYRLFTALWFQDRGFVGGLFNIPMLLLIGFFAENFYKRWAWSAIYLVAGLGGEVMGLLWKPIGAGNSVAYLGLAGAMLTRALLRGRGWPRRALPLAGFAAAAALAILRDIHGAAMLIGGVMGLVLLKVGANTP